MSVWPLALLFVEQSVFRAGWFLLTSGSTDWMTLSPLRLHLRSCTDTIFSSLSLPFLGCMETKLLSRRPPHPPTPRVLVWFEQTILHPLAWQWKQLYLSSLPFRLRGCMARKEGWDLVHDISRPQTWRKGERWPWLPATGGWWRVGQFVWCCGGLSWVPSFTPSRRLRVFMSTFTTPVTPRVVSNENHRVSWREAGNHRKSVVDRMMSVWWHCKNESIKYIERGKPYQRSEPIFAFDRDESYLLLLCFLLCHHFSLSPLPVPPSLSDMKTLNNCIKCLRII